MINTGQRYSFGRSGLIISPSKNLQKLSVDRNCEATYIGQNGSYEIAQPNELRIDWSSGAPQILIESQSANLLEKSEDFTDAYWRKQDFINTGNTDVAPDGTAIPIWDFIGYIYGDYAMTTGLDYVLGIWIKANQNCTIELRKAGGFGITANMHVNLTTDWIFISDKNPGSPYDVGRFMLDNRTTNVANLQISMWRPQVEQSASLSSYIATNGAVVTRLADQVTVVPPVATKEIIETVNGTENIITSIPPVYQLPVGYIDQIQFK